MMKIKGEEKWKKLASIIKSMSTQLWGTPFLLQKVLKAIRVKQKACIFLRFKRLLKVGTMAYSKKEEEGGNSNNQQQSYRPKSPVKGGVEQHGLVTEGETGSTALSTSPVDSGTQSQPIT